MAKTSMRIIWGSLVGPPAELRKVDERRDTLSHEALGVLLHLVSGDNWRGRDGRTADSAGGYCGRREATEGKRERKREGGQSRTKARGSGAGAGRGSLAVDATDRDPLRRVSRCNCSVHQARPAPWCWSTLNRGTTPTT